MAEEKRYVDADKLIEALRMMPIPSGSSYHNGALESQISQMINTCLSSSFIEFKEQLLRLVQGASSQYDKCMLCVQRDTCIPEHPLGENR